MKVVNILWIRPPDTRLTLIPGDQSPLKGLIESSQVISYDNQSNYPFSAVTTTTRQLNSALPERRIIASILNLSAVPRNEFIDGSWTRKYLGGVHREIPYGRSTIFAQKIGVDIDSIDNLDKIISEQDLVVVPLPFETQVPEAENIARSIKRRFKIPMLTAGSGVEGHEEGLLRAGYDVVFVGTVSDSGEKVLESLIDEDWNTLCLPGVYSNLGGREIKNLGARNFRQDVHTRRANIKEWRSNLPRYQRWTDTQIKAVGRPDLETDLGVHPLLGYCCAMQDLPFDTIAQIVSAGKNVVFTADEFFPTTGCPRECDFCHAAGSGMGEKDIDYCVSLLDFHRGMGATDIIPTDDQVLLTAVSNMESAKNLIDVYEHAKSLGFHFFYGNGVETYALAMFSQKSTNGSGQERVIYRKLLDCFFETLAYVYLPYESIEAMRDNGKPDLRKLRLGKHGFVTVLDFLNERSASENKQIEVGTNIIFSDNAGEQEIRKYYEIMDGLAPQFQHINLRYTGFFTIPSYCAPHIIRYRQAGYTALSDDRPELKVINLPDIMAPGKSPFDLEQQLAWKLKAEDTCLSRRRLRSGTYI